VIPQRVVFSNSKEEVKLFQKKEIIFSETLGVCTVDDIVKLSDNRRETYNYYLLRSVYDKTKKAYIPIENHSVQLRNLITKDEAKALLESDDFNDQKDTIKGEVRYVLNISE
jgi:hypothetical protein